MNHLVKNLVLSCIIAIVSLLCPVDTSCPPWTYYENGVCNKSKTPPGDGIIFEGERALILDCYCITYQNSGVTDVGKCFYNCFNNVTNNTMRYNFYHELPRNVSLLNRPCTYFNRDGTLCGHCHGNSSPLAYSFDLTCVDCPYTVNNWLKFIAIAFIPLTFFYFTIVLFRINLVSPPFQGFVLYCQSVTIPALARILLMACNDGPSSVALKIIGSFYGIWNLDFLRFLDLGICLRTSLLLTLSLDMIVAMYPMLLMVISYFLISLYDRNCRILVILWRPFQVVLNSFRRNLDIRTSLIESFAAFLFLSSVKLLSVAYDLLMPVQVYSLTELGNQNSSWKLYYDANIPYFGKEHLPYAIVAIAVLVVLVVLPALLLLLYPFGFFQKVLNTIPMQWHILHTFMDSFHGCYKDGTEPGSKDCRWFASVFFFIRIFLFCSTLYATGFTYFTLGAIVLALFSISFVIIQPFKSQHGNIAVVYILLLALFHTSIVGFGIAASKKRDAAIYVLASLIACLPLLYVSAITLKWITAHRMFGLEIIQRWRTRNSYQQL